MSTHPIDIIANAILAADSGHPEPHALAAVAADALTDPRVVEAAMHAMYDESLHRLLDARILDGPDGGAETLKRFALVVLRSVAGGA